MLPNKLISRRLQKEEYLLQKDPIEGILIKRQGLLNFYFVIHNLDKPYNEGFYFGLLQLHENYPFAAPKLFFYTKSGRFQINTPICTSFTNYHQQTWTSAWNIRTLLLATVSFMTSQESSYGCRTDSQQIRMNHAKRSLKQNYKNPKFCLLFSEELDKIGAKQQLNQLSSNKKQIMKQSPDIIFQSNVDQLENIEEPQNNQELLHHQNQRLQVARHRRKVYWILGLFLVLFLILLMILL